MLRSKTYSLINIAGLSVGMAAAMLIGFWVWDELSYNKYHQNYDRIAQVMKHWTSAEETSTNTSVSIPVAEHLRTHYGSDFKRVVLSSWNYDQVVAVGDNKFIKAGNYMEPEAPDLLSLRMLRGSRRGLADPNSILLSASLAESLFGDQDPLGEIVKINNQANVKVTGVYEDIPDNSSFKELYFIVPWELYTQMFEWVAGAKTAWANNSFQIFTELNPQVDPEKLSAKIEDVIIKNDEFSKAYNSRIFLHPMSKWKLHSDFEDGVNTRGFIQFVWLFGVIGVFVLLLACINFMNLSTARSEKRAKEVGIRKSVGSPRKQLIGQFLSESFLMVLLGFGLALLLVLLSLPWFNQLVDKKMNIPWENPVFWLLCGCFIVLTGFISGSYPAFYLSSFQPVKVLKGTFRASRFAAVPRKVLVTLQFTVSVMLIIGTIVVFRQIQHVKSRSVGYSRDRLITVPITTSDIFTHFDALRKELMESGALENMAVSSSPVTGIWADNSDFYWRGKDPNFKVDIGTIACTHDFGETVGWKILKGRDFSRDFSTDSTAAMILNETAAKLTGFENPVGERIKWGDKAFTVVGVVEDMVMGSPFRPVMPTVLFIVQRLRAPGADRLPDRCPGSVLSDGWVAGAVFVPHRNSLVDIPGRRHRGLADHPADGQLPGHQSGADEPGEEPAVGLSLMYQCPQPGYLGS